MFFRIFLCFSFSPVRIKQDVDFSRSIQRQQLAKRLNSNVIYLFRAPEKQKKTSPLDFNLLKIKEIGPKPRESCLIQMKEQNQRLLLITLHFP